MLAFQGRYRTQFIIAMVVYVVLLLAVMPLIKHAGLPQALRALFALLPMVPLVFVALACAGAVRDLDELQRRIQFEGLAFAFALTALLTFSYGFLQVGVGLPAANLFFVWPLMAVLWVIGLAIARRRYR